MDDRSQRRRANSIRNFCTTRIVISINRQPIQTCRAFIPTMMMTMAQDSIDHALTIARTLLPPGWHIEIRIDSNGIVPRLIYYKGNTVRFVDSMTPAQHIHELTQYAIAYERARLKYRPH